MSKNTKIMGIQPTVLILFILFTSIIMIISFTIQYYFLKDLASKASTLQVETISNHTKQKIISLDEESFDILSILSLSQNINTFPKDNEVHKLLPLITSIIKRNNHIYAIYSANKKGEFFEVINLNSSKKLREKYSAPLDARWLILKIFIHNDKKIRTISLVTKDLKTLDIRKNKSDYHPITRPWFIKAIKSKSAIKTDPYLFTNLESFGTTYSKKLSGLDTVISIDISLKSLSDFLENQLIMPGSEAYLLRDNGLITSSAKLNIEGRSSDKLLYNDFKSENHFNIKNRHLDEHNQSFTLEKIRDKKYYLYYEKLDSLFNNDEYLAILLPYDVIMKDYDEKIIFSSFVTLLVFLLIMPLVWMLTRLLVIPIHQLSIENKKISNLDFDNVKAISTHIKEFEELSISLVSLSKSIKKHQEDEVKLMDSFIKIIASSIDAKSKYTGGHCERVPILSMMIAQEASSNQSVFKDFKINNKEEERELSVAAWLHDCGKVTTPEYVVDKATKLETIYNRIHEIRTRFEVIHRDLTIESLTNMLNGANKDEENRKLDLKHEKLHLEYAIIARANIGSEYMPDCINLHIQEISKRTWLRYFDNTIGISRDETFRLKDKEKLITPCLEYLLSDKIEHIIERVNHDDKKYKKYKFKVEVPKNLYNLGEIYNLSIKKGTLTSEERYKINEHSMMSIIILEELPFPNNLKRVAHYATCHHETLIGTGYPRKLKKEDMSFPSRIIALADVFEALTSSDRPYKEEKTLCESIEILSLMVKDKHLDEDIFKMFLETGIYLRYANEYLKESQIDEVDISLYI